MLPFDVAAQAIQSHARVIGHRAIGKNLAAHIAQNWPRIGGCLHLSSQAWILLPRQIQRRPDFAGLFDEPRQLQNLLGLQHGAFDAKDGERGRNVGNGIEPQPNGRAPRGCLRLPRGTLVSNGFGHVRQGAFERGAIRLRRHLFQFGAAQRAADVAPQQFTQRFEFQ